MSATSPIEPNGAFLSFPSSAWERPFPAKLLLRPLIAPCPMRSRYTIREPGVPYVFGSAGFQPVPFIHRQDAGAIENESLIFAEPAIIIV